MLDLVPIWAVLLFMGLVTAGLIIELQFLRSRVKPGKERTELTVGTQLPKFDGTDVWTGVQLSTDTIPRSPSLFVFVSTVCPQCKKINNALPEILSEDGDWRIILVCSGKQDDCKLVYQESQNHREVSLLWDKDEEIRQAFGVSGVPVTFVVSGNHGPMAVRAVGRPWHPRDFRRLMVHAGLQTDSPESNLIKKG
jgi:glutaredoxin